MTKCSKCGKKRALFDRLFSSTMSGLCMSCHTKKSKKIKKALPLINDYIKEYNQLEEGHIEKVDSYDDNIQIETKKGFIFLDLEKVVDKMIKSNYGAKKVVMGLIEEELVDIEAKKIKEREKKRRIREQAEVKLYGKVRLKRKTLTEEEKEMVFDKFNNECAVCGKTEGLHIHHKDENSSNNQMNNLVVLCGVCHKKTHMKIR